MPAAYYTPAHAQALLMEACVQMLLDIAHERDEDIPALIYEARGVRPCRFEWEMCHGSMDQGLGSRPASWPASHQMCQAAFFSTVVGIQDSGSSHLQSLLFCWVWRRCWIEMSA